MLWLLIPKVLECVSWAGDGKGLGDMTLVGKRGKTR